MHLSKAPLEQNSVQASVIIKEFCTITFVIIYKCIHSVYYNIIMLQCNAGCTITTLATNYQNTPAGQVAPRLVSEHASEGCLGETVMLQCELFQFIDLEMKIIVVNNQKSWFNFGHVTILTISGPKVRPENEDHCSKQAKKLVSFWSCHDRYVFVTDVHQTKRHEAVRVSIRLK